MKTTYKQKLEQILNEHEKDGMHPWIKHEILKYFMQVSVKVDNYLENGDSNKLPDELQKPIKICTKLDKTWPGLGDKIRLLISGYAVVKTLELGLELNKPVYN